MVKVCITKCRDYSSDEISAAIKKVFSGLSLDQIIKPGSKVLLKPNLLFAMSPDKGATTHPEIVKAIAQEVIRLGAKPFIGDSPGGIGALYPKVLKATGMEALGIPIVDLEDKGMRKFNVPGGKVNPVFISNVALSFDIIINIPKLKTHELTKMTCSIKNMFGCVPGLNKVMYHLQAQTAADFSEALVDLFERIKPSITIVDAVVAMEGQGPSNGKLKNLGLIVASTDAVAVDAVCSKIIGFEPLDIATTRIANKRGLGEADINKIDIIGEKIEPVTGFEHPKDVRSIINRMPFFFRSILRPFINRIRVRPKINKSACIKCMTCVKSCPTQAIDGNSFNINKNKCIMCFCCRELCKYRAVDLHESILWKILTRIKKNPT